MKKTIAILLVLVIGMAGVFAEDASTVGNTTDIQLTTSVASQALFGVSAAELESTDFTSFAAFSGSIIDSLIVATQPMTNFKATTEAPDGPVVGYLSGINNTQSTVYLKITTTAFTSETLNGEDPIALTVTPDTSSTSQIISAATGQLGTLENVAIKVRETTPGSIDLAPAAPDYEAIITITVSAS